MTGWRLGWLVLPPAMVEAVVGVLLEYITSCAPVFVQAAGLSALTNGDAHVAALRAELTAAKDQVLSALRAMPDVEAPEPDGGMYAFFRLEAGRGDLHGAGGAGADRCKVVAWGSAPGSAFGDEGAGWLRWCFAARPEKNAAGLRAAGGLFGQARLNRHGPQQQRLASGDEPQVPGAEGFLAGLVPEDLLGGQCAGAPAGGGEQKQGALADAVKAAFGRALVDPEGGERADVDDQDIGGRELGTSSEVSARALTDPERA